MVNNKHMEEYKYDSENEDLNIDNQQLDYYNQQEDIDDILNDIAKPTRQRAEPR